MRGWPREDDVEWPDGSTGICGVVEKPHFALVPADRDGSGWSSGTATRWAELRAMIRDGRLTDSPSLAAYTLLQLSR